MRTTLFPLLLLTGTLGSPLHAFQAHDEASSSAADSGAAPGSDAIPEPSVFTTRHTGTFHGTEVAYTAVAGETYLRDDDGNPTATLFSIAYLKDDVEDPSTRPVTFLWNGGPGSSSVWLHMGVFGPVRVDIPSDARDDGAPPYPLVPNPGTFLDLSDIVFLDPVGTGFSRPLGEAEGKDFYGVKQDAEAVARFIRQWISDHGRWNSPKFLGGESYGTTRAAAVVRELESGYDDVALNGILLISTILDFSIENHAPGNELPNLMHVPTMAATAKYHGMAGEGVSLEDFTAQARHFALNEYAHALLQGNDLGEEERAAVRARLAHFTGLSEAYLERTDLRPQPGRFQKELLRERGLTVGRLDSRYTGIDLDDAGEHSDQDPSFYGIDGAYAAAVNSYMHRDLDVRMDRHYNIIGGLGGSWDWKVPGMPFNYFNLAPWIGQAMRQNSGLEVYVAAGYYDFATPFFAAEYSLNRAGVVPERVHFHYYESGHMMYVHHPSLHKMLDDVHGFLEQALSR